MDINQPLPELITKNYPNCIEAVCFAEVTLFEKAPLLGGRAATQTSDGFMFNRGVHGLYTGGAASRALEELGITYSYGTPKDNFEVPPTADEEPYTYQKKGETVEHVVI